MTPPTPTPVAASGGYPGSREVAAADPHEDDDRGNDVAGTVPSDLPSSTLGHSAGDSLSHSAGDSLGNSAGETAGDAAVPVPVPAVEASPPAAPPPGVGPRRSLARRALTPVLVLLLAVGMLVLAGVLVRPGPAPAPSSPRARTAGSDLAAAIAPGADVDSQIRVLQTRVRRLPADWQAWASLGVAYVQQARITADPTYYPKAQGALERSKAEGPADNALALTGMASLAAARHDFAGALDLTKQAERINAYSAVNYGLMGDALLELGRYDEGFAAIDTMNRLRPGVPAYTRASYSFELQGRVDRARSALQRALDDAFTPSDRAYALYYLGELAWNTGDLADAAARYGAGLRDDSAYLPLLAGRAKVEAAQGDTAAALRDYADVTARLPLPQYLIEYVDLLNSLGRTEEARVQADLVRTEEQLFTAQGVNVDLELALFDADHGQPQAALAAAEREYAKRRSVLVEDALAWALHVNGRDAEALPHAQQATRLGYPNALLTYHRGMIEKALGRTDEARRDLTAAMKLNPHFSTLHAPRARAALAELGGAR